MISRILSFTSVLLALFFGASICGMSSAEALPKGFVYLDELIPSVRVELRYATAHNFIGERIDGYRSQRPIMTRDAALALRAVQEDLRHFGLGLKIFDAYRPQRAVDHFVRWAKDVKDIRMKREFYPGVAKQDLFREDYISSRSGHSRGSAVDLTIVSQDLPGAGELDMGSNFDFFGPESWPEYGAISPEQRAHRMLLQSVMKKHGFRPYAKEWWHFTLENEPHPNTYFNFSVQ